MAGCFLAALLGCDTDGSASGVTGCVSERTLRKGNSEPTLLVERRGCRARFVNVGVELRADPTGSHPDPGRRVVRDRQHRYYSANAVGFRGVVSVWDSGGRFLQTLGQEGEGPSEFSGRGLLRLWVTDTGLNVVDGSGRLTLISPTLDYLSKRHVPNVRWQPDQVAILSSGAILSSSTDGSDYGFSIVNPDNGAARHFGPPRDIDPAIREPRRPIAYGGGATFWFATERANKAGYLLEEWDTSGLHLRTLERRVTWPEWRPGAARSRERPPPSVVALHVMENLLLVYVGLLEEEAPMTDVLGNSAGENLFVITEIVDPRTGLVLSSRRLPREQAEKEFPRAVFPGSDDGYVLDEDSSMLPRVRIVRLSLSASR